MGSRRILTEMEAKEAAMNGATVRYRRSPPYLRCPLCGGDGTNLHPFYMWCSAAEHPPGWEVVEPPSLDITAHEEDRPCT